MKTSFFKTIAAFLILATLAHAEESASSSALVLTPKESPQPRINGAGVFGVRPGSPFLYTIAASGQRPLTFVADGLPAGLILSPTTGRISGVLTTRMEYAVSLTASNAAGMATRKLRIVVGDKIALTPPMGWGSWKTLACSVDEEKIKAAADAMAESGLINHGWSYINIEDCWEGQRSAEGKILANQKFPDMQELSVYVHSRGLKIGLSSTPGPTTCAGFEGSLLHEELDARQFAEWGIDSLKYDWCSYGSLVTNQSQATLRKPYEVMQAALVKQPRDILYNLSQSGLGNVWSWGAQVGGNTWRTTRDIKDSWDSVTGIGFSQAGHERFAGHGHWNDPDMLMVGKIAWNGFLTPTKLTPNEQYTQMSLWCLLAAPLMIGCDLKQLDPFTLGLLSNDEVLEVDQDPHGAQAWRVTKDGTAEVWAKEMADGSQAVGLFNRGSSDLEMLVRWSDIGLSGEKRVRDLWRQTDLGRFKQFFQTSVPSHGVALVRIYK